MGDHTRGLYRLDVWHRSLTREGHVDYVEPEPSIHATMTANRGSHPIRRSGLHLDDGLNGEVDDRHIARTP